MSAGRNIDRGPGGEAPGSKRVLGDQTGISTHSQGLEIIISLNKKIHGILSLKKTLLIIFPHIPNQLSVSINLTDSSTIKTERTNAVLYWTQTRI